MKERTMNKRIFSPNLFRTLIIAALVIPLAQGALIPAQATADPGTIAYVRSNDTTGDQIRLIEPDGSNDRLLWRTDVPDEPELEQITALAWHPAATELAFASRHEEACSFYNSDIYALHADGLGYRRVTAPPACGKASGLPTGTVNVYIENWTIYSGPFYVYFEGAPEPKIITLAPNSAAMVTFTKVADYGGSKQWAVVIFGKERFTSVSGNADVVPGKTVDTASYITMWYGTDTWGWTCPTWSSDGSQIGYVFNGSTPYKIPADSRTPGEIGSKVFDIAAESFPSYPDFFTWAPPGPRKDQLLYSAWARDDHGYLDEFIFVGTAGSTSPGEALIQIGEGTGHTVLGLTWLPDSTGFLYSKTEGWNQYANIFRYSFSSGTSTRLTNYTSGYPRHLSISPDGNQVVYEYQAKGEWTDLYYDLDLWMMDRTGKGQTMFVQNARAPAWSPVALPEPVVYDSYVFLPSVCRP
jgi:hypothetical protein